MSRVAYVKPDRRSNSGTKAYIVKAYAGVPRALNVKPRMLNRQCRLEGQTDSLPGTISDNGSYNTYCIPRRLCTPYVCPDGLAGRNPYGQLELISNSSLERKGEGAGCPPEGGAGTAIGGEARGCAGSAVSAIDRDVQ